MNNENYKASSYLSTPFFVVLTLLLTFFCAYGGMTVLTAFLCFLFLLSGGSYLWGRMSAEGVEVNLTAESHRVYPGQEIEMHFSLKNDKGLPLLWLEWIQPYPPNHCLEISPDFQVCDVTNPEAEEVVEPALCRGFSYVGGYATVEWTSTFRAVRRGVYLPQTVDIQTGDGFGLKVAKRRCELGRPPVFVIYPQRVAVYTEGFLKSTWSATTGPHGTIEDVTVLRGTRDYMGGDSFKRINWRLAARGGGLSVNLYDTIAPRSLYFLVDTATFHGISEDNAAFEETLSVVGSLVSELFGLGMSVGLYLPHAIGEDPLTVEAEHSREEDCLLALSLCHCNSDSAQFSAQSMANLAATQSGNIYYICYDGTHSAALHLLEEVGISRFSVMRYTAPQGAESAMPEGCPLSQVADHRKGG